MTKKLLFLILAILILSFLFRDQIKSHLGQSLPAKVFSPRQTETSTLNTSNAGKQNNKDVEILAENLNIPWEIVFLPSGDLLVTERPGKLLLIGKQTKVVKQIEGVKHVGEGGLLGLALHPEFVKNNFLYLYYTTEINGQTSNRVERYKFVNNSLQDKKIILDNIKGSRNHDGGRIAFGPDGFLYIATGDAEEPNSVQDKTSLNGKILRITDEGATPSDNPFGNAVFSLGHRNPQGLAWDNAGNLWVSEHGPSGLQTGHDEINLITKGGNYGWPKLKGGEAEPGLLPAKLDSGKEDTWAPASLAFFKGSLYFAGLRGAALYEAKIDSSNNLNLHTHLKQQYGRLRAVVVGPDNFLYITTSNTDGRGKPNEGDDKIIKINPESFR